MDIDHGTAGSAVHDVSIRVLGGLRIERAGEVLSPRALGGAKPRQVLLALVLDRGLPVSKERLVALLWGDCPPSEAVATLETYVSVLRKRLQPGRPARASVIRTVRGGYALDTTQLSLDLARFEMLLAQARHPETPAASALSMLNEAIASGSLPLLPEETDAAWIDDERMRHESELAGATAAAARAALAAGDHPAAAAWARAAIERDTLDEGSWIVLLEALEAAGRHGEALRVYDQCRRAFAEELGCAPGPAMRAAYDRLLRGATDRDDELADLMSAVLALHQAGRDSRPQPAGRPLADARRLVAGLLQRSAPTLEHALTG